MASLSTTSINRPVLAIIMSLVVMLFGFIGYSYLGIREYPSVDSPIITVSTSYTGANAEVIESQVTEVLEESINGIAGIRTLTSISREGRSIITVEFNLEADMESAANDVRDRVSRVSNLLPRDSDPPTVAKADADASPIVYVGIKSSSKSLLEISDIANSILKERLQTIPGVSIVQIWGEKKFSMRLWMDALKLAAFGLAPQDVVDALAKQNIELPSGSVEGNTTELTVRTMGRLYTEDDFNNLIIKDVNGRSVKFKDIGYAKLGPENEKTLLKDNGLPMIGVVLVPQPGSNQIEIANQFYKRLEALKKDIPKDVELILGFDNTQYIRASISEVVDTIITSFVLVVLVIFLFLRDGRSTLIPVVAIPISLIGTFFVMYLCGFSINVLSLLGIVLAIGLVVDDAIVVLENIYAKIEAGAQPRQAAIEGSNEIYFAVISTTVVLAAVFLPVIFLQGISGRLFREFGIVVAASVIISAFVSLSLTPMLSSRLLKHKATQPWFYRVTEPFYIGLTNGFGQALTSFMRYRWLSVASIFAAGFAIWGLLQLIPSELSPQEDRNGFRMVATGPEGATFEYMTNYVDTATALIEKLTTTQERKLIIGVVSPGLGTVNSGFVRVILQDADQRKRSQQEIVESLMPNIAKLSGARSFVAQEQTIGGSRGIGALPLQYVVQASSLEELKKVLPKFQAKASENPAFSYSDVNLRFNKPEIRIDIDRDKAQALGVSIQNIAQTLQLSLAGQRFGYFIKDGKQYQVIGQMERGSRNAPVDLTSLYVRNNAGQLIQVDNLVKTTEQSTPPAIYRFNRSVSATVSAQLAKGVTLSQGIDAMDKIAEEVLADGPYTTTLDGGARDFKESSSSLLFSFLIALTLIYLILAAQFESFATPVVIMFTVPLALFGALFSLWYFHQTLNVFSQIGIIMLIGLVTKNGILIVEFANQRHQAGLSNAEAVHQAAVTRFRPILMTSLCCILGILPIALALGAGSETRVSMGIAVVGGMIFSTGLTLFILPPLYTLFTPKYLKNTKAVSEKAVLVI